MDTMKGVHTYCVVPTGRGIDQNDCQFYVDVLQSLQINHENHKHQ